MKSSPVIHHSIIVRSFTHCPFHRFARTYACFLGLFLFKSFICVFLVRRRLRRRSFVRPSVFVVFVRPFVVVFVVFVVVFVVFVAPSSFVRLFVSLPAACLVRPRCLTRSVQYNNTRVLGCFSDFIMDVFRFSGCEGEKSKWDQSTKVTWSDLSDCGLPRLSHKATHT